MALLCEFLDSWVKNSLIQVIFIFMFQAKINSFFPIQVVVKYQLITCDYFIVFMPVEILIGLVIIGSTLLSASLFGLGYSTHKWCVEHGPMSPHWDDE